MCNDAVGGDGTCWNERVTSCKDIRDGPLEVGGLEAVGGGVSPSSDFTSCRVNGTEGRSSAIPFSELTAGTSAFEDVCAQRSFKCSGSGARAEESLIEKEAGGFVHEAKAG